MEDDYHSFSAANDDGENHLNVSYCNCISIAGALNMRMGNLWSVNFSVTLQFYAH